VPIYVRWCWPDGDVWAYDELDADRWSLRHVEVRRADGRIVAAGSLAEVLAARDTVGIDAVCEYESKYGVVPEGTFPEPGSGYDLEEITAEDFEALWRKGRQSLGG
jgi:hypothetical protein